MRHVRRGRGHPQVVPVFDIAEMQQQCSVIHIDIDPIAPMQVMPAPEYSDITWLQIDPDDILPRNSLSVLDCNPECERVREPRLVEEQRVALALGRKIVA